MLLRVGSLAARCFMGKVAHFLRTPLRVIVFFSSLFFLSLSLFLRSVGFAFAVPSPWCYLLYILQIRILKSDTVWVRMTQRVIYSYNLWKKAAIIFSSRFHFSVCCHGPDQMNERTTHSIDRIKWNLFFCGYYGKPLDFCFHAAKHSQSAHLCE